jgi:hypothetical protein
MYLYNWLKKSMELNKMSLVEIWSVAMPLVLTAFAILVAGLVMRTVQKKGKAAFFNRFIGVMGTIFIVGSLLFLLYTLIRAIIFLYLLD